MTEGMKYLVRTVGITGVLGIVSLLFTGLLYGVFFKLIISIIVAELIWAFWFKPFIGTMEGQSDTKLLAISILRGSLLVGCILGACLGL